MWTKSKIRWRFEPFCPLGHRKLVFDFPSSPKCPSLASGSMTAEEECSYIENLEDSFLAGVPVEHVIFSDPETAMHYVENYTAVEMFSPLLVYSLGGDVLHIDMRRMEPDQLVWWNGEHAVAVKLVSTVEYYI